MCGSEQMPVVRLSARAVLTAAVNVPGMVVYIAMFMYAW